MGRCMRALAGLALAMTGLVVVGAPAHADGGHYGDINVAESPRAGLLRLQGWAYDADDGNAPVKLHLYVGGPYTDPTAQFIDLGVTGVARPDVPPNSPGAGPNTGFDRTVEVSRFGEQPIFLYALNAVGASDAPTLLPSRTPVVRVENPNPGGEIFSATSPGPGQVTVNGFAVEFSESVPDKTRVVVTTNGTVAGTLVADQRGPRFEDFPVMFNGTVPAPAGDVQVCVTAVNQGVGSDQRLGCRQVQVAAPPEPPVVTPPPVPTLTLAVKAVKKKSRLRIDVGPDLAQSNYRLRVQRKGAKGWKTVKRTQTLGSRDRIVLDLPRGHYRIVVPPQQGMAGARATVRLRR